MIRTAATYESPIAWVVDQLQRVGPEPPRRVVVLVPAERHAHAIRRAACVERNDAGCLVGVRLLRPVDFAREVLARAGAPAVPGWEPIRELRILTLFSSAALEAQLRYFTSDQLSGGRGYVDAFARTISDLESSGLTAAAAQQLVAALEDADRVAAGRLHDVALVWSAADSVRAQQATTDEILDRAAAVLAEQPQLAAFGPAFALLTTSPTTTLMRLLVAIPGLQAVLQEARPLRQHTHAWRAGLALAPAAPAVGEPSCELDLVHRFAFEPPEALTNPERPRSTGPDGTVDLEEYASIEEEIEAAAIWVAEQLMHGSAAEDIALIVPDIDPYATALIERLRRLHPPGEDSRLPVHVAGGLSLARSPAGLRLLALAHALTGGLAAEAVIRLLPALRHSDQAITVAGRLSPSRAAEIVYHAGILGGSPGDPQGMREWVPRLRRRREQMVRLAALDQPDPSTAGLSRLQIRECQDARRWLKDIEPLLPAIEQLQALAECVASGPPLAQLWAQLRAFCEHHLRLPPDPPGILTTLAARLEPLMRDDAALRGGDALHVLARALHDERWSTARYGEPAVFIGTPAHAAGLSFGSVRMLGVVEGALPHTPHDDPIIPDVSRREIQRACTSCGLHDVVIPTLADRVLDDIQNAFRVLSGTRRRLAVSAPRQWTDRSDREVSGVMLELATALGRRRPDQPDGDVPTASRLRAAYFSTGREARAAAARARPLTPRARCAAVIADASSVGGDLRVPESWLAAPVLDVAAIQRLGSAATLSGMDGVVSATWAAVEPPGLVAQRPISASALAMLLACPHRFLLERILHCSEPPPRPSSEALSPVVYGALVHLAADRFFREAGAAVCRREGDLEAWILRAQEIACAAFDELRDEYPMRGADGIARERDRLLQQIRQLVEYEWRVPAREFLHSELRFGEPEAVRVAADSGDLYLWGAIDRLDRLAGGGLSLRDLKTGRVRDLDEEPLNTARDLQLGTYVIALEAAGTGAVDRAAYVHPSAAQEPDRAFAGPQLDSLRRHTRAWLGLARDLLRAGVFPRTPNPDDCLYCPFVPACGDGAQARTAARAASAPLESAAAKFVRFKHTQVRDDG